MKQMLLAVFIGLLGGFILLAPVMYYSIIYPSDLLGVICAIGSGIGTFFFIVITFRVTGIEARRVMQREQQPKPPTFAEYMGREWLDV